VSAMEWVGVVAALWLAVSVVLSLLIGTVIRRRDAEMDRGSRWSPVS
jgi:hypothetical protein